MSEKKKDEIFSAAIGAFGALSISIVLQLVAGQLLQYIVFMGLPLLCWALMIFVVGSTAYGDWKASKRRQRRGALAK